MRTAAVENMRSTKRAAKQRNRTDAYSGGVLIETNRGALSADIVWNMDGMRFVDPATGESLPADAYRPNCRIIMDYDGSTVATDVTPEMRVQATTHFPSQGATGVDRYFLTEGRVPRSRIYPPSAEGGSWYARMVDGNVLCSFFLQRIRDTNRFWLTVLDSVEKQVIAAHPIRLHEFAAIWMREDTEVSRDAWEHVGPEDTEAARRQILSILDEPKPSDLSRFWMAIRGAEVLPAIGPVMRNLVEPLVPESLTPAGDIRDEFKAFLAMTVLRDPMDVDPVDLSNALLPTRTLRGLYSAHMKYILSKEDPPPYVKIFLDAASRRLQIQDSATQEQMKPHEVAWLHVVENSPDWTSRALKYCGASRDIALPMTRLPVTREQAATDIELRKDRAALAFAGYSLRTLVNTEAIGLEQVIFRGSAHTWPHGHLAWLTVLSPSRYKASERLYRLPAESGVKKPPTLQLLTLPSPALKTLYDNIDESTRQNWRLVEWRNRSFNPDLYNPRTMQWTAPFCNLNASEIPELSLGRLKTRSGTERARGGVTLDRTSARALDLTSSQFYLDMLESKRFLIDYNLDPDELESILQSLRDSHVILVQHAIKMTPLPSIAIDLRGEEKAVCGLTLAIMQGTPTTSAWISEEGKRSLLLTHVPRPYLVPVSKRVLEMADRSDIQCTLDEVASYSAYLNDLYQRLLRENDSKWDDDISDLLSQFSFTDSPQAVK